MKRKKEKDVIFTECFWRLEFWTQSLEEADAGVFPEVSCCGVIAFFLDAISSLEEETFLGQSKTPMLTITVFSKECARDALNTLAESETVSWEYAEFFWEKILGSRDIPNVSTEEIAQVEKRMLNAIRAQVPMTLVHLAREALGVSRKRPN